MNKATSTELFPWQQQQWDYLQQRAKSDKLPHALLFIGAKGLGKLQFAQRFAQYLLCEQASACGKCHACRLFVAYSHPDISTIDTEKATITVDSIRQLQGWLVQSRHSSSYKVAIINSADKMNKAASNALLKSLEEPCAGTILLLVTDMPSLLPATIRSRCQSIKFSTAGHKYAKMSLLEEAVSKSDAELLLRLTDDAPLHALELAATDCLQQRQQLLAGLFTILHKQHDPIAFAAQCKDHELRDVILWLMGCVVDLIRASLHLQQPCWLNQDYAGDIKILVNDVTPSRLYKMLDRLMKVRQQLLAGFNMNKQLLLESLFCQWNSLKVERR